MSMNPTAIEWTHVFGPGTGYTYNPTQGCTNNCPGCYAKRLAKRTGHLCPQFPTEQQVEEVGLDPGLSLCAQFHPHFHPERLSQVTPRQKPRGVFVGSMADLWDPHVPQAWRDRIWEGMAAAPQHVYFLLTKQPQNVTPADTTMIRRVRNAWVGYSWDGTTDTFFGQRDRRAFEVLPNHRLWASYEPARGPLPPWANVETGEFCLQWLVIGAQTGPGAVVPEREWIERAVGEADEMGTAVFVKDNLAKVMGEAYVRDRQAWPSEM